MTIKTEFSSIESRWNKKYKRISAEKRTSFCLDAVSSISRTSISIWTPYFFKISGSLNSAKGIRAAKENPKLKWITSHQSRVKQSIWNFFTKIKTLNFI